MNKIAKALAREVERQGCATQVANRGRVKVYRDGHLIAVFPTHPAFQNRGLKNAIAALRRQGLKIGDH